MAESDMFFPAPPLRPSHRHNPATARVWPDSQGVTESRMLRFGFGLEAASLLGCAGVTLRESGHGGLRSGFSASRVGIPGRLAAGPAPSSRRSSRPGERASRKGAPRDGARRLSR